ncbi:hypothetical protein FDT66_12655 [Polaribacter aestuariivivens]|uniref:Peptidyl-prolyl cis-trans isomerase n=1 Tax=Polaribacter aestuariivivens TaxID=2304626 RepID=A0A5S3N1U4_9FLAO|nr:hypothetical protein [Polaribacter aestuariivivens]TMM28752.1 hypothetical protein FDT66_12655 [Polaribacter aestuariivivens]
MRFLLIAFCIFTLTSCDYFTVKEKETTSSEIVAIVNTDKLFREDLKNVLPNNISKEDSIVLVKSYIQDWAIKKLFLKKAENNSSLESLQEIDLLVNDYRESLLINKYKTEIINQKLDTIISEEEIETYYNLNKDNFKLNEELVKAKYISFDKDLKNEKEIIKLFQSDKIEDQEELERKQLSFKIYDLNDSVWTELDKILLKVPFSKENLLKKTKFIQKQDSLSLYLVAVKDILPRNEIAPLSYIESKIKQMILHKRKIELIRDIEKIIVKDATKNNNFKIY